MYANTSVPRLRCRYPKVTWFCTLPASLLHTTLPFSHLSPATLHWCSPTYSLLARDLNSTRILYVSHFLFSLPRIARHSFPCAASSSPPPTFPPLSPTPDPLPHLLSSPPPYLALCWAIIPLGYTWSGFFPSSVKNAALGLHPKDTEYQAIRQQKKKWLMNERKKICNVAEGFFFFFSLSNVPVNS